MKKYLRILRIAKGRNKKNPGDRKSKGEEAQQEVFQASATVYGVFLGPRVWGTFLQISDVI